MAPGDKKPNLYYQGQCNCSYTMCQCFYEPGTVTVTGGTTVTLGPGVGTMAFTTSGLPNLELPKNNRPWYVEQRSRGKRNRW